MKRRIIPLLPLERLLKRIGANRVSKEALKELSVFLEERLSKVVEEAVLLAQHAGRKTIKAEDIRLARKKLGF